jgi:hypothetical protein
MTFTVEITVPDTIYRTLVETANQTGQSIEVVASEWLRVAAQQLAPDPLEPFIGAIDSSGIDWADNHDNYIGQIDRPQADQAEV